MLRQLANLSSISFARSYSMTIKLSRGHVINDAFIGSPSAWVMQRTDVDCFYGGAFEGDFLTAQKLKNVRGIDHFFDSELFNAVRPAISYQGKEIKYFLWQPKSPDDVPPTGYSIAEINNGTQTIELCVRDAGPEIIENKGFWNITIKKDLRLQAFVSVLKAAHLSMFSMFGYYYALSNAGRFMGEDILGRFYKQAKPLVKKRKIQQSALRFFRQYRNIVQYSIPSVTILEGTLVDGYVNVCAIANGTPWGMIVFVKILETVMAALLPFPSNTSSAFAVYLDFLLSANQPILEAGREEHAARAIAEQVAGRSIAVGWWVAVIALLALAVWILVR